MAAQDFTHIPILDLSLASTSATKPAFLASLRDTLLHIGFLYLSNHGVPNHVIQDLIGVLPELFAHSLQEKEEVKLEKSPHFLGYSKEGAETTAGKSDEREQFEFATELRAKWTQGESLAERLRGPNQWPSKPRSLRPIVESYIASLTNLSTTFLSLVAEALQLPPATFHPFLSDQHRLKLAHYPASLTPSQGVGPHKDSSGWWTFLLQASPPHVYGLQVLNKAGFWIDVPPVPGTLVVNIGQGFEAVTHGVCRATVHRVLSGPEERFSVPFFQGMRRDLTKSEALGLLRDWAGQDEWKGAGEETSEGREVDCPWLRSRYETWGEAQLRTKVRSHRDVGKRWYADEYARYIKDDSIP